MKSKSKDIKFYYHIDEVPGSHKIGGVTYLFRSVRGEYEIWRAIYRGYEDMSCSLDPREDCQQTYNMSRIIPKPSEKCIDVIDGGDTYFLTLREAKEYMLKQLREDKEVIEGLIKKVEKPRN